MVFWPSKCNQKPPKIGPKSIKKTSDFLIDCLSHLGSIVGAFFHYFCFQKYVRIGKGDFIKMSFSCTRGAHFQGFRSPRSIQKSMKKTIEKWYTFSDRVWMVWGAILWPFWDQNRIFDANIFLEAKIMKKRLPKWNQYGLTSQLKIGCLFHRFWTVA